MGIELKKWEIKRNIISPLRVGYYGGLQSTHNQNDALKCYNKIMPIVWETFKNTQLWIIGSSPPINITNIPAIDDRVHVTGFVEDVKNILSTMSVVICPWEGVYGFRSRIIELMALGIPIVTSREAVEGMGMESIE